MKCSHVNCFKTKENTKTTKVKQDTLKVSGFLLQRLSPPHRRVETVPRPVLGVFQDVV